MINRNPNLVYLDCASTTPVEDEVLVAMENIFKVEYGNAGSRTHEYGVFAQRVVQEARDQVASVVGLRRENVIFSSGATESNNMAILGLEQFGLNASLKHIITSQIEHFRKFLCSQK